MTHNAESEARVVLALLKRYSDDIPVSLFVRATELIQKFVPHDAAHTARIAELEAQVQEMAMQGLSDQSQLAAKDASHTAELEALRERAAMVGNSEYAAWTGCAEHHRNVGNKASTNRCHARASAATKIAAAIRALPLTEKEAG